MEKESLVRKITINGILAALYVGLSLASIPLNFGIFSIRISEILILIVFFKKEYIFGLVLGTFISNFFTPMMPFDIWLGTIASLLSLLAISFCKNLLFSCIFPITINAFLIAIEMRVVLQIPYWVSVGAVALSELICVAASYIIFLMLGKKKFFLNAIKANQNKEFKF